MGNSSTKGEVSIAVLGARRVLPQKMPAKFLERKHRNAPHTHIYTHIIIYNMCMYARMLCSVMLCLCLCYVMFVIFVMLCYVTLRYVVLCHVEISYAMLSYVMLSYVMLFMRACHLMQGNVA